jgi:GDP-L-fucose synthase
VKRILITGTGKRGFVGRNLAEAFKGIYELYTPASKELDLTDSDAVSCFFDRNKIDVIIHAAASFNDKLNSDLKMFFNLEKHSKNTEKFIYFGSGGEFDKRFDIINAVEDEAENRIPADEYGFAKYIMNSYARRSANIYNLRLFGIFGKYEDWTYKFISNLCCKAIFDLPLSIRRECRFDYVYIDDLPEVVTWFIENKPDYNDYNFVSGKSVLLSEIAKIIVEISGKKLDIIILNPDGLNNEYTASSERLKKLLPWFEPMPIYAAIEKLYKWYFDNKSRIDFNILRTCI